MVNAREEIGMFVAAHITAKGQVIGDTHVTGNFDTAIKFVEEKSNLTFAGHELKSMREAAETKEGYRLYNIGPDGEMVVIKQIVII